MNATSPFDRPYWLLLHGLVAAWAVVSFGALGRGAVGVSPHDRWAVLGHRAGADLEGVSTIVWQVRLPRVLLGGLAGLALSVAGVAWQGVLRNPLADPYLIGASAGGALGAGLAILFGIGTGGWLLPLLAFAGSLAAVAVVVKLATVPGRGISVERLLLAGVAVSSFLSALLSLASFVRSESFTQLYFWLIGGLSGRGWEQLGLAAPYVGVSIAAIVALTPRLNVMQLGEETAHGLGVDVARDQLLLIGLAALLTASVVAVCGMIGFVGLVVPHLARLIVGPDLRRVLPIAAFLGASLLVLADLLARVVWVPVEVPVGILTAMMGAPFFLFLLMRQRA
jgi:iron complex transport system permease protein